jgi:hypothetical protein
LNRLTATSQPSDGFLYSFVLVHVGKGFQVNQNISQVREFVTQPILDQMSDTMAEATQSPVF